MVRLRLKLAVDVARLTGLPVRGRAVNIVTAYWTVERHWRANTQKE